MCTRKIVRTAFEKCLEAVEPRFAVRNAISILPDSHLKIGSSTISLEENPKIVIVSIGKASLLMARGAQDRLKSPLLQKTLIIAPEQQASSQIVQEFGKFSETEVYFGARDNLPDENSILATRKITREIQILDSPATIFLFLISGGGSALLTSPSHPVTLSDKLQTIKLLQSRGATIQELNIIRQQLSDVKGGKLVIRNIQQGRSIALLISDVIGNPVDLIASGPTVIPTGYGSGVKLILENLKIEKEELPESVRTLLNDKKDLPAPFSSKYENFIISSNNFALLAASENLKLSGIPSFIVTSSLSGNASEIGGLFADLISSKSVDHLKQNPLLKDFEDLSNLNELPVALLFGGETTVKLSENAGKGGRNQEMVLSCLVSLKERSPRFTFLSAGTDGQDGPTDAAGAIISNSDLLVDSSSASDYLKRSDSYNFWKQFNGGENHLITGPSGTNVMDIQILILDRLN